MNYINFWSVGGTRLDLAGFFLVAPPFLVLVAKRQGSKRHLGDPARSQSPAPRPVLLVGSLLPTCLNPFVPTSRVRAGTMLEQHSPAL